MCSFQAKVDILNKLGKYRVGMDVNNVAFTIGSSENFCRDPTESHLYIGNCTKRTYVQANTTISVTATCTEHVQNIIVYVYFYIICVHIYVLYSIYEHIIYIVGAT